MNKVIQEFPFTGSSIFPPISEKYTINRKPINNFPRKNKKFRAVSLKVDLYYSIVFVISITFGFNGYFFLK